MVTEAEAGSHHQHQLVPRFHRTDGCFARAAPPRIAALIFPGLRPDPKFAPRISGLARLPLDRIASVHLGITSANGERRALDDHRHDVPGAVYHLLTEVAARTKRPLTIILERDGAYPSFGDLLDQLERAREAPAHIDRVGPELAAQSLERKRSHARRPSALR